MHTQREGRKEEKKNEKALVLSVNTKETAADAGSAEITRSKRRSATSTSPSPSSSVPGMNPQPWQSIETAAWSLDRNPDARSRDGRCSPYASSAGDAALATRQGLQNPRTSRGVHGHWSSSSVSTSLS
ncbi:hypothetical protein MLD38_032906 [Melastoma candidum]|uniref:Uncharacterized protein n=1 Tax=Melastoma candidum TaxID=119954 RepID=A0ACB9M6U9_9MYRT|nr:hypothetical protein MLD38_032906 [Melastoma candidum]